MSPHFAIRVCVCRAVCTENAAQPEPLRCITNAMCERVSHLIGSYKLVYKKNIFGERVCVCAQMPNDVNEISMDCRLGFMSRHCGVNIGLVVRTCVCGECVFWADFRPWRTNVNGLNIRSVTL